MANATSAEVYRLHVWIHQISPMMKTGARNGSIGAPVPGMVRSPPHDSCWVFGCKIDVIKAVSGVVQKAPFLGNTDNRFPHHAEGDFVVKAGKPEGNVAPSQP